MNYTQITADNPKEIAYISGTHDREISFRESNFSQDILKAKKLRRNNNLLMHDLLKKTGDQ